ncbi:MAG: hypothetical protein FWG63_07230, partial [Defluviitaleaceae bacterium]|nr:hypothetical protein [Defluviitaleaceae bacterium]
TFTSMLENNDGHEPVKIMNQVVYVTAGSNFAMALREDGTLWAWGNNSVGQLARPPLSTFAFMQLEPMKIMEDVVAISSASHLSMAIKSDNSLWGWGWNFLYPILIGLDVQINVVQYEPTHIMDDVKSISLSDDRATVIKTDGSLWIWGGIWQGDIYTSIFDSFGIFSATDHPILQGTIEPIKIMENVRYVSVGNLHLMAIKDDNSLWAMGWNEHGQLGDGTTTHQTKPIHIMDDVARVSVSPAANIRSVSYTLVLKTDGTVWSFGSNSFGELGTGEISGITDAHQVPQQILENIIYISAADKRAAAIDANGNILEWGDH